MLIKRFKRDKAAVVGVILVALGVLLAVFGPTLSSGDPSAQNLREKRLGPSLKHPFGTDAYGRDMLTRILFGARLTVMSGLVVVFVSMFLGMILGVISGYWGGMVDNLIMRIMDFTLSMPYFLLAILVVAILGPALSNAIIAVTITRIPQYARVVRCETLKLKGAGYVEAAKAMGASNTRIILEHIIPNLIGSIIVLSTVGIASAVTMVAALSFLGMGARPPAAEWGLMLSEGRNFITSDPHMTIIPGAFLALFVLGLNLMGDGLRDTLDPRLK